jgi:hypothetical protein
MKIKKYGRQIIAKNLNKLEKLKNKKCPNIGSDLLYIGSSMSGLPIILSEILSVL